MRIGMFEARSLLLAVCLAGAVILTGCGQQMPDSAETFTTDLSEIPDLSQIQGIPEIPPYSCNPFVVINGNKPMFTEADFAEIHLETDRDGSSSDSVAEAEIGIFYSELDELGRCGAAWARLGAQMLPEEPRDDIGNLKPTGWHTVKYNDLIADNYLYNRCHLIGYQLGGENADLRNLMTGTRYLNVEGMLPFENRIVHYLRQTGNPVLYRVTPVFTGENLLADGVILEAKSVVDDGGEGICFCVFAYNVQPRILIDYATGDSEPETVLDMAEAVSAEPPREPTYILNKNSGKFHLPACKSVSEIADHNRQESFMSREELTEAGFSPCQICDP